MVKVSVIVPVYNVEKYIDRCLNSLVNQTLDDIEIIVVNDGSPDNSQKIIDKYAKKYKFVKSFIKKNGGISSTRNFGIEKATGEYISFVDSDDYVDTSLLEKLYNKAKEKDFDVAECDLKMVDDDGNLIKEVYPTLKEDIFTEESKKKYMINMYTSVWNKIYKKELFDNNVLFKEGVWFEDVEFLYKLVPFVKTIGFVHESLCYYVQREGSITKTFDDRLLCYVDNWNGIVDFYKKKKFYNKYYDEIEYSYVRYLYASFLRQSSNYKDKKQFKKTVDMAIENVKDNFSRYRRNKYFYRSIKGIYLLLFNRLFAYIIFYVRRK